MKYLLIILLTLCNGYAWCQPRTYTLPAPFDALKLDTTTIDEVISKLGQPTTRAYLNYIQRGNEPTDAKVEELYFKPYDCSLAFWYDSSSTPQNKARLHAIIFKKKSGMTLNNAITIQDSDTNNMAKIYGKPGEVMKLRGETGYNYYGTKHGGPFAHTIMFEFNRQGILTRFSIQ